MRDIIKNSDNEFNVQDAISKEKEKYGQLDIHSC